MYCRFCGREIPESGRFCPNCGKEADIEEISQAGESQKGEPAERMPAAVPMDLAKNYHMAWFKFIIYFQLFANAVVMIYNAAAGIFGLAYGDDAGFIYAVCPMLKAVDVIYGVICLAFAVTAVLIRQRLAHYRKDAPVQYLGYVGVVMALALIYTFAVLAALGTVSASVMEAGASRIAGNVLGTVIGAAVYLPLNYVYFKKRKELFVN